MLDTTFAVDTNIHPGFYLDITNLNDSNASKIYNSVLQNASHIIDIPERAYRYLKSKLSSRFVRISDTLRNYIIILYKAKINSYTIIPCIILDKETYRIKSEDKELELMLNICDNNGYLLKYIPEIETLIHKEVKIWH